MYWHCQNNMLQPVTYPTVLMCSERMASPTPSSSSALHPFVNVPMEKPSERACRDFSKTTEGTPTCTCRDHFGVHQAP